MLILILIGFAVAVLASASGCGSNRTVFVPEASPMRVGPDMSIKVYIMQDGQWVLSGNRVPIPEGWYLVAPSWVAANDQLPTKPKKTN
jgi:hypothetical protein